MAQRWILLTYSLPREPSAPRVALWRKLKKLGAILSQDTLWVLPETAALQEQVRWLAAEIGEAGGSARVWHAEVDAPGDDAALIAQFVEQAESGYRELLDQLDDPPSARAELARRYRQIRALDYFRAPSRERVRARLEHLERGEREP